MGTINEQNIKTGCVIMASGLGKRFGGNKLLEEINGKPLIQYILDSTNGLYDNRIVVTRHKSIANLCEEQNIECILHDKPYRSDTVRLGLEGLGDINVCTFFSSDQPLLKAESIARMLEMVKRDSDKIYRMSYGETVGNPITFPRSLFDELLHLPEGKGGSYLIKSHVELLRLVEADSEIELMDIDTREDFDKISELLIKTY